jgi:hypothetical protein
MLIKSDQLEPEFDPKPKYQNFGEVYLNQYQNQKTEHTKAEIVFRSSCKDN